MARRQSQRTQTQTPDLEPEADEEQDIDDIIVGELGAGSNLKLSLYRVSPGTGTEGGWIDDISPDQIEDMRPYVRENFGGGTYILRVKKVTAQGARYFKQYRFVIEAPRKHMNGVNGQPAPAAAAAPGAESVLDRILTRIESRLDQIAQPKTDPFEMFSKVAELIKTTRVDAPTIGAEQLMQVWQKGMETAQKSFELTRSISNAGGETSLMDLAKSLIEAVGPTIGASLAQSLARGPGGGPVPNGAGPAAPQLPAPDEAGRLDANLRDVMAMLARKAALNADVDTYAEVALDELDPALIPMLQQPNILDQLATPFPAIAQYRPWFDALRTEMLTVLREQEGQGQRERGDQPAGGMPGDS